MFAVQSTQLPIRVELVPFMLSKILQVVRPWAGTAAVVAIIGTLFLTSERWYPKTEQRIRDFVQSRSDSRSHSDDEGKDAANSAGSQEDLYVATEALESLGLTGDAIRKFELTDYTRTVQIPGVVVERPGRSRVDVAAPLTGIVTSVNITQGEAVAANRLLFTMRLTHEDLVQAQGRYLTLLGQLDVEQKEIARLIPLSQAGSIPARTLIERQYEKQKLEAEMRSARESLLLHGLTEEHVELIEETRMLKRELTIRVPELHEDWSLHSNMEIAGGHDDATHRAHSDNTKTEQGHSKPPSLDETRHSAIRDVELSVEELNVEVGEFVTAGTNLCVLADFSQLYLEGRAFERDTSVIQQAMQQGWKVSAVLDNALDGTQMVTDLPIAYLSNRIEEDTRAIHFYVRIDNELLPQPANDDEGIRHLLWRFRPGQRLQLRVPVEVWKDQIVLPVEAVVRDGLSNYVFTKVRGRFRRVEVTVDYRDQYDVVIRKDRKLKLGQATAMHSAQQLQMAMEQAASGGGSGGHSHAGHSH